MSGGKRYQPEQVVNLLRQIEVAVANGKTTAQACKEAEIVEQTYFRWRQGVWRLAGGRETEAFGR
jgi:putative transposase